MEMHVQHTSFMPETLCGVCRSQISVEGDVIIPGSLRESADVLHASAMAVVERAESMQGRVSIGGRVVFTVLYSRGEKGTPASIEAAADFTQLCELPGAVPRAEVFATAWVEQVEAHAQSGRMSMRAVVGLCARAMGCEAAEAVSGIDLPGVQMRTSQLRFRRRVGWGSKEILLREEFLLPAELAVTDTLGARAAVAFHDTAGGQGRIGLSGEVTIEAVHASDVPGKPIVTTRYTVPVSQSVEMSGESGEVLDGRIVVKDIAVASQENGNGERVLRAEVLLGLSAWAEREENISLLTDAYATSGDDLRLNHVSMTIRTGDHRTSVAESGKAALMLPAGAKPVRTMLAAFANPVLKRFAQQGNRLVAEGKLDTTLLYLSDEGTTVSAQVEAPFRTAFAAEAAPEDILLLDASSVEAVPITSDRVELRYILHAQVEGVRAEQVSIATEAEAVPASAVTRDIVLYYAQPGETAWDIARRYRIPEEELRALNPGLNGEPKAGQGLVVWHRADL